MKLQYYRALNMKQLVTLSEYLTKLDVSLEKEAAGDPRLQDDWDTIGKARSIVNRLIKVQIDEKPSEGNAPTKWAESIVKGREEKKEK